jgi:hypothetical protein
MGRNLFIRVSAVTYDQDRMRKEWPHACALAWPEEMGGKCAPPHPPGGERRCGGIMELVADILDRIAYGSLPGEQEEALRPLAGRLKEDFRTLETALENRDAALAGTLTNRVEDALDALELSLAVKKR